jgi:flagellar motor switch protein FliN
VAKVTNSVPDNPAGQVKVLEPLAQAFVAGFTQAARNSLQSTASVVCLKTERTSLRQLLRPSSSFLGMEIQFDEGISGAALLLIEKPDLARIAGLLSGLECTEEMAIAPEFIEASLQFFAHGIDAGGKSFAQACGLAIHGTSPRVVNPEAKDAELRPMADAYAEAVSLSFQVNLENLPSGHFYILVAPNLLASLNVQLPHYTRPAADEFPDARVPPRDHGDGGRQASLPKWNIDLILDVELEVAVSFGEAQLPLRDVLKLGVGSVIELEKGVNDPVTITVNDKPIVRGEVVVVEGNYGVKVLEVESTADRIRSLGR